MHQCANNAVKCLEDFLAVKIKVELDSHADTYSVGDQCLVIHNHNRPVNAYGYDPKLGLKHAHMVDAAVAYDQPVMDQVLIFLINQAIEMICLIKYHMNCALINELPKLLEPIPSKTM